MRDANRGKDLERECRKVKTELKEREKIEMKKENERERSMAELNVIFLTFEASVEVFD